MTGSTDTPPTPFQALLASVAQFPTAPGVYIMHDAADREIYVGKAKSLRKRVRQYFDAGRPHDAKTLEMLQQIDHVRYIETDSEVEAFLLENRLIKDLQPKFNVMLKSNMQYPYVEVTWGEEFPRVLVTRDRSNPQSTYYGPYIAASWLRSALQILQRVFQYRTCALDIHAADPKWRHYRPCLEYYIGRCRAPCNLRQTAEDYRAAIRQLVRALTGQFKEVRADLHEKMRAAADLRAYEEAARLRDMIRALDSLRRRGTLRSTIDPAALHIDPVEGLRRLGSAFALPTAPRHLEGIDIAHLQGEGMVGSLVSFIDGLPERNGYRRFKIKSHAEVNDFASIGEVVRRRYGRLLAEQQALPDIILIDGGLGQLHAAYQALQALGLPGFQAPFAPPSAAELAAAADGSSPHSRPTPVAEAPLPADRALAALAATAATAAVDAEGFDDDPDLLADPDQAPLFDAAGEAALDTADGPDETPSSAGADEVPDELADDWASDQANPRQVQDSLEREPGLLLAAEAAPAYGAASTPATAAGAASGDPRLRAGPAPGPFLCALAKREELIYTVAHREGLRLTRRNPGLRLLQHVRDEAHRFARHYHHLLRKKLVMGEERAGNPGRK
ncbi:MAG: GIY-YIG nuclease family protein [Planctomycetota bacterium]